MLIVNQGVQGPRVVALQILLNRSGCTGTPLQVDGHYGPKTAKAVTAFRSEILKAPGPGAVADLGLWNQLLNRNQLQTIECVDLTDSLLDRTVMPELAKQRATTISMGGTSNGVDQFMRLIESHTRYSGSVMLLRFHSHGGPGVVAMSHGTRQISAGIDPHVELSVLDEITMAKLSHSLASIRDCFADFGFAEFHACRVAEGPKGGSMLQSLADIWKVPVTAGLTKQKAAEGTFQPTGAVHTFFPGKMSLRQWAESREEAMRPTRMFAPGLPMLQPAYSGGMCTMAG